MSLSGLYGIIPGYFGTWNLLCWRWTLGHYVANTFHSVFCRSS